MGSTTTSQLAALIDLQLFARGIHAEILEAEYGTFRQEILDSGSDLYRFEPDFVFLATSWRDVANAPDLGASIVEVEACLTREYGAWSHLWHCLDQTLGAPVIQSSFLRPSVSPLGNYSRRCPSSKASFLSALNERLFRNAPDFVSVLDLDQLAARDGAWSDSRYYHHAKLPCAPESLCAFARAVASIIAAHLGKTRKCLVLDLDNTLWGGVVGDDGVHGIRVGQGDAISEAYADFQKFALELSKRGVILAVCSANDEAIARRAFEEHPGMILKLEDISCFVANWEDKASNLREIAARLGIGVEALVFFDDDATQRSLVRRMLPEVAVPEVPDDPSEYVDTLAALGEFETVAFVEEDRSRTSFYRKNEERSQLLSAADDLMQFLESLEMAAIVELVSDTNLDRCAQLIGKTNQFNLTTHRYSRAEVARMTHSPDWLALALRLEDRFGDNGLVSVILAEREGEATMRIDTWVMSCRVLSRGVEQFFFERLCEEARRLGASVVRGQFVPTAKNGIVAELFDSLGFRPLEHPGEGSWWELDLSLPSALQSTFIREVAPR